jgi:hypothetical protein
MRSRSKDVGEPSLSIEPDTCTDVADPRRPWPWRDRRRRELRDAVLGGPAARGNQDASNPENGDDLNAS